MKLSNTQYKELSKDASRGSKALLDISKAFLVGGTISLIGQTLLELFSSLGLDKKDAGASTSLVLIALSVLLTGLGIYPAIAKHGGAGTLVPITGFANAVASPAIEFRTEGWVLGVGARVFSIAGPVILYGTAASAVYGVIYCIISAVV